MHLVQLLLPLYDAAGRHFDRTLYDDVASEMTARFGGLTAYARAPAMGLWLARPGDTRRDDVVVFEVMVEALDRQWWAQYRRALESRFAQNELVIRMHEIERL